MTRRLFTGFSTVGKRKGPFTLYDNELIKQDLLNELMTDRGEAIDPNYGSIIREILMDPFDDNTTTRVSENVQEVIQRDPRVIVHDVNVIKLDRSIRIECDIAIQPNQTPDKLIAEFDND